MARVRSSRRQLIQQRRRQAFVGRDAERAAFRDNLDLAPDAGAARFLFHVHGNAGVGKTFLVRELEQIARDRGALTAYVDEAVGSVPDVLEAISAQCAAQGHRFKELDRLLAVHRERRYEAEVAALTAAPDPQAEPSVGSTVVARVATAALGYVPVVGPLASAGVDSAQLARGVDQMRTGIGTRFRNQEDARLVREPEQALTPVLLREVREVAVDVPSIVLFLDTYERTGPVLDRWLHDVLATDRYGEVPDNLVVVTSGQYPLDTVRWGDVADFVTDLPLEPFTEAEARGLLADRGVVAEPVVAEVLRLTGGLPVLVSTLAQARPVEVDDVGDPSVTAVDRFLKWEQDPVRRAAALACAFPRQLDADIVQVAVRCADDETDTYFEWLRGLPFVSDRGDQVKYHDLVRAPMLRLQRHRSPRQWIARHRRLAQALGQWRAEIETELGGEEAAWADEWWRRLRLEESYHRLCAGLRTAPADALRDFVVACDQGEDVARRWVGLLRDAGEDTGAQGLRDWADGLAGALERGREAAALELLLQQAGELPPPEAHRSTFDWTDEEQERGSTHGPAAPAAPEERIEYDRVDLDDRTLALAHVARGKALRGSGAYRRALAEYDRALALAPDLARAHRGKALAHADLGDYRTAIGALDRALEREPDHARSLSTRGEYHRILKQYDEALADLDRAIRLDPAREFTWASRGATWLRLGDLDRALADLDRALELEPDYAWALVRRARVLRDLGEPTRQMDDLDRAVVLQPDWAWGLCERGDALRSAGHHQAALADYDRALDLDPAYASAYASRAVSRAALGRHEEALADLDRAVELKPHYAWALGRRALVHLELGDPARAQADADRALSLRPDDPFVQETHTRVHNHSVTGDGRHTGPSLAP
ncbi:tetratricopeptide repeat protein [Streptomyces acidicola]|uniref:tetratricopeptide repeat protein n=1 Tax=Streptomyces acidicola TaxID=2596892 RepID=UPI00343FACE7